MTVPSITTPCRRTLPDATVYVIHKLPRKHYQTLFPVGRDLTWQAAARRTFVACTWDLPRPTVNLRAFLGYRVFTIFADAIAL